MVSQNETVFAERPAAITSGAGAADGSGWLARAAANSASVFGAASANLPSPSSRPALPLVSTPGDGPS